MKNKQYTGLRNGLIAYILVIGLMFVATTIGFPVAVPLVMIALILIVAFAGVVLTN